MTNLPQALDQAKRKAHATAGQVGQKARETGQSVQGEAHEATKGSLGQFSFCVVTWLSMGV
ncbi:hypothetical protein SADUNF_Sadunf12G0063400 [Salix dunnii]|uniref:Uncharacterized protein n=1 Tax=Salix dunnii TaxID=1413687 RepID=A0A835JLH3_9ROSI|nr:hypothetical protein SADUNF_Sadunf12G0063400 [Salix dunnii]